MLKLGDADGDDVSELPGLTEASTLHRAP